MSQTPTPVLGSTADVYIPAGLNAQLAAYTDDTRSVDAVLAPLGWTCRVQVGADGSTRVDVYPPGEAEPSSLPARATGTTEVVSAMSTSTCQGCTASTVCALIPTAPRQLGFADLPCRAHPSAESVIFTQGALGVAPPYVVEFEDPAGVEGSGGPSGGDYPAKGVLLYRYVPGMGGTAAKETCVLPANEWQVCQAILNDFADRSWMVGWLRT